MDKYGENMNDSVNDLWKKVVDNLNGLITMETYNLWIAPLKPLSLENNIFTVAVPNIYFSQWIESHQLKNIEKTLSENTGHQIILEMKPQQDLAPILEKVENTPAPADVSAPVSQISQRDQINSKYVFERFVVGSSTYLG